MAAAAWSGDLTVAPADLQLSASNGRRVTLTPTEPRTVNGYVVTIEPRTLTVTNGAVTFSNVVAGIYKLDISGAPPTSVRTLMPDTNGLVNAAAHLVTSTNAVLDSAAVAYTAGASDARYALKDAVVTNFSSSLTLTGSPAILTLQSTVEGDPVSASLSLDDIGDLTMLASGAVTIGPGDVYLGGSLYGNSFSGAFSGDGSSLTNLPVAAPVLSDAAGVPTPQTLALTLAGSHTGVVHPNVLALSTNWQGYQYWLAITGAGTNADGRSFEDNEQPHIFASRDLVNWEAKGSQPLIARYTGTALCGWGSNGWLADPEIYLDPAGTLRVLYCAFRNLAANQFSNAVLCASSPDGTNWTHEVLHYAPAGTNSTYAGPQIVRDHTNGLRLYYVDEGNNLGGTNKLFWVAGLDTSGTNWDWAATNTCSLTTYQDSRYAPWHFSIACVDGTYHLVYGSQSASLGEYSTSTNGTTWSAPGMGVFERQGLLKGSEYTTYKSAMWPVAGPNGLAWNALVGTAPLYAGDATGWRVKLLRGLTIDPQSLTYTSGNTNWTLIGADKVYGAINRMGPFVVSDRTYGTSGGLVALGQPFNGWGGIALGYNSPMAATNYAIASEGFSVRVNAKTGGTVNLGVNNAVRVTASDTLLSATVPTFVPAMVVTNAVSEDYVLRANSGGVSVGPAYNLSAATISAGAVSGGAGTFTSLTNSGTTGLADDLTLGAAADLLVGGDTRLSRMFCTNYIELGASNRTIIGDGGFRLDTNQFVFGAGYRPFYAATNAQYSCGQGYLPFYSATYATYSFGQGYQPFYSAVYAPYSFGQGNRPFFSATYATHSFGQGERPFYSAVSAAYSFGQGNLPFYSALFASYSFGQGDRPLYSATNAPFTFAVGAVAATNITGSAAGSIYLGPQVQSPWGAASDGTMNVGGVILATGLVVNAASPVFARTAAKVGICTTNLVGTLSVGGSIAIATNAMAPTPIDMGLLWNSNGVPHWTSGTNTYRLIP